MSDRGPAILARARTELALQSLTTSLTADAAVINGPGAPRFSDFQIRQLPRIIFGSTLARLERVEHVTAQLDALESLDRNSGLTALTGALAKLDRMAAATAADREPQLPGTFGLDLTDAQAASLIRRGVELTPAD